MADTHALNMRGGVVALVATGSLLLLPLLFVQFPPLHDYPFHLARVDILHRWQDVPAFHDWYQRRSLLLANVGMDVVGLLLTQVMPVTVAGKVLVGLIVITTLTGCVFLHWSLHAKLTIWPFFASFFVYNWIFLFGFMGYLLGVGLMLWACGAWVWLSRAGTLRRLVGGSLISFVLLFCHLVPFGLYAIFVAGYELQRAWHAKDTDIGKAGRDLCIAAAPFIVPLVLLALSDTGDGGSFHNPEYWYVKKLLKVRVLFAADWVLDGTLVAVVVATLAMSWRRITVTFASAATVPLVLMIVTFVAMPLEALSSWFVDTRLVIAIAFVALAAVQVDVGSAVLRRGVIVVFLVYLAFRSAFLAYQWRGYDHEIIGLVGSLSQMPAKSLLFVASAAGPPQLADIDLQLWQPPLKYAASLVVLNKPVFVVDTYADPNKQPLGVTPAYRALYDFQAHSPIRTDTAEKFSALVTRVRELVAETGHHDEPLFLLLLYPSSVQGGLAPALPVISRGPRFTLFRLDAGAPQP